MACGRGKEGRTSKQAVKRCVGQAPKGMVKFRVPRWKVQAMVSDIVNFGTSSIGTYLGCCVLESLMSRPHV